VALQDPKERGDIAREIVDHLDRGGLMALEEDAAHADERLDIGPVRRLADQADEVAGQIALAAEIRRRGSYSD